MESHLLQMRGLKLEAAIKDLAKDYASHLLQMRGLKLLSSAEHEKFCVSHLLQMRGLKLRLGLVLLIWIGRIFYRCVD